jgi:Flp pilus assembly pilin Flp
MQCPFHLRRVLKAHLPSFLKDDLGQGLVEYALTVVLVALATIAVLQVFACRVNCAFEAVANRAEQIFTNGKKIPPGKLKQCSKKCD